MKSKLMGIALFMLTLGAVVYYPELGAKSIPLDPVSNPPLYHAGTGQNPQVDVVFVLDTTGSMSGLIQTAKDKIWSIATTMASAQPTPDIRIGLVAYRDRGDQYVTRTVDLSGDLDSVYATLMDFEAGGGGDSPESVNEALYDTVHNMSWSAGNKAYRVVFLVGDAPPHMDYNEVQFPEIVAVAKAKGIVINTIQCGEATDTLASWTQIANLGQGSFFQVEQAGSAVAYESPFDREIAELSARLDDTRIYYGTPESQKMMSLKVAASDKLEEMASLASLARRGVFNAAAGGRQNLLGENELVEAFATGKVKLAEMDVATLPEALRPMAPEEQEAYVTGLAEERAELQQRIRDLSADRDGYIAAKVDEAGGMKDSLDMQLYEAVREQGGKAGLKYEAGPSY